MHKCNNINCDNIITEFRKDGQYKKYCSKVCQYADPSRSLKISAAIKSRHADPVWKDSWHSAILGRDYEMYNKIAESNRNRSGSDKLASAEKKRKTCMERYGTDHYSKTPEFNIKFKETCLNRYGVEHHNKNAEINTKMTDSLIKRYEVDGCEIISRTQATNMKRYGEIHYNRTDEGKLRIRETCLEKYGVDNFSQTPEFSDKFKNTCLMKYGVEHPSQDTSVHEQQQKKRWKLYTLPSGRIIKIQGFENMLLDELLITHNENCIIVDRKLMPKIFYIQDNITRRYFPDVYIPYENLIIEVKSTYTVTLNIEKNILKAQAVRDAGFNFLLKVY